MHGSNETVHADFRPAEKEKITGVVATHTHTHTHTHMYIDIDYLFLTWCCSQRWRLSMLSSFDYPGYCSPACAGTSSSSSSSSSTACRRPGCAGGTAFECAHTAHQYLRLQPCQYRDAKQLTTQGRALQTGTREKRHPRFQGERATHPPRSACTWFVFHLPLPRPRVPDAVAEVAEDDCAADDDDEAAVEDAELVPPARLEEAPAAALPALGPRDADAAVAARRLPALPMLGLARTLFRLLLPLLLWLLVFPARIAARVGAVATAA